MKKVMAITLTALLSLSWMAGCASTDQSKNAGGGSDFSQMDQTANSSEESLPEGLVVFEGRKYMDVNRISRISFDRASISKDIIEDKIGTTSEFFAAEDTSERTDPDDDIVNFMRQNAVFYSIKGFDSAFRILVEADDGRLYIYQNIDDQTKHLLAHKEQIQHGAIYSALDVDTALKQLDQNETIQLLELFANTKPIEQNPPLDEQIDEAYREGTAYHFYVVLQDQTNVEFGVIPSLNLLFIGGDAYTSDSLQSDVAFLFDGLPQITE